MIIGEALLRLFTGATVNLTVSGNELLDYPIQFHYGDEKELVRWTKVKDASGSPKYPLLWYVTAPYEEEQGTSIKVAKSKFVILHGFKEWEKQYNWMNDVRSFKSYDQVIEPVWIKCKKILAASPYIQIQGSRHDKYLIKDEGNFGVKNDGVRTSQSSFSTTNKKGEKSISLDIVDGRIIEFKIRINTKCIK